MLLHTHMMSALIPFLSSCRRCFSSSFSTCQHRRHQKQGPQTPLKGLSRKVGQQYTLPCGTFPNLEHFQGCSISTPRYYTAPRCGKNTNWLQSAARATKKRITRSALYYSSTTPYYKVLLQYYFVLQRTPVLQSTGNKNNFGESDETANHQLNAPPCGGTDILATRLRSQRQFGFSLIGM